LISACRRASSGFNTRTQIVFDVQLEMGFQLSSNFAILASFAKERGDPMNSARRRLMPTPFGRQETR